MENKRNQDSKKWAKNNTDVETNRKEQTHTYTHSHTHKTDNFHHSNLEQSWLSAFYIYSIWHLSKRLIDGFHWSIKNLCDSKAIMQTPATERETENALQFAFFFFSSFYLHSISVYISILFIFHTIVFTHRLCHTLIRSGVSVMSSNQN